MEELRYEYWMVSSKTCIVIPHNARDIASLREDRRPHIYTLSCAQEIAGRK